MALIIGTMIVGQLAALSPNYSAGIAAAGRIFNLLDRIPEIDSSEAGGLKIVSS